MENKTGRVLRIEKTSIHDGDGLRTVVFLKGCPLRCKWCSTPESQRMEFEFGYGMDMTADEVVKEVCKDEIFFFHSGGGVTVSGGEPLVQAGFVGEILKGCREHGIDTAVETSLYAPFSEIEPLLPSLTAMYIDFKVADEARHTFYTGVSNRLIRENLQKVNERFTGPIHIRIPVIPTVNLFEENMQETVRFLDPLTRVADVELLPYHRLGMDTYRKMNRVYELKGIETPSMDEMRRMARVFQEECPRLGVKIKGEPVKPV